MKYFFKKRIYLDNASTTPLDLDVLRLVNKANRRLFANSSSIHSDGVIAKKTIDESRKKIAKIINAHSDEIIFTGSGTESNALAILGIVNLSMSDMDKGFIPHIVTTNIEHPSVLENFRLLADRGDAEVTYVKVKEDGIVDPKEIKKAIKKNTVLVSVMFVNNEIGTIQPIQEIAKEIRHFRKNNKASRENYFFNFYPVFHTDACQAINYLDISNIEKIGVDMMTFNGSKIYGPKGVGVLYKKRNIKLSSFYNGGGQEFGLRPGTENTVAILGITKALEITEKIKNKENNRLIKIRDSSIDKLLSLKEKTNYEIILNGDKKNRIPNNINISVLGISSELLVIELDALGISISEKSACQSDKDNGSYVIRAIKDSDNNEEFNSLRISLGRNTKKKDMDYLVCSLEKILNKYKVWK